MESSAQVFTSTGIGVTSVGGLLVGALLVGFLLGRMKGASLAGLVAELRAQLAGLASERDTAREDALAQSREREQAQQELMQLRTQAFEREKRVEELKQGFEDSRAKLLDAFKATGVDVLKQNAQTFLEAAKEQLFSQNRLSQQDLEARQKAIDLSLKPLQEQLSKQEQLVNELNLKREGDSKALSEQVKSLLQLQGQARDAALALSSAMRDHRQRGRWGEVALKNVAELAGLTAGIDFFEQEQISTEEGVQRPDMVVRLPNGRVIPVDSKVPLTAYLDSLEPARADGEREALRLAHAQALRTHVRALARRDYAKNLDGEIELTILFVPVESAFTAAFEADPSLFPEALEKKVIVATPSTLLALLRTVALHWKSARLAENAEKIGREAGEFLSRMGVFLGHFSAMGEKLDASVKAYNKALGSVESRLQPSVARIAGLLSQAAPETPEEITEQARGMKSNSDSAP
jgi:DNA recombination protein RmuC